MNPQTDLEKFENVHITVDATIDPGCAVKLTVVVHKDFVTKSYQEALHRVRKEISIPGFRKGKAPDSLLISHYSKAIDNEWRDLLLNNTFQEALKLTSFAPVKASAKEIRSHIKELKSSQEEALITFEFESVPLAPSIDKQKLHVPHIPVHTIEEQAIQERVEEARISLASWESVEERPVQEDDFVRLDIFEIKDEEEHPDFQDQRFQVTEKKMAPWLRSLVIGMNVGDSKEGMSSPDEAFVEEEAKGSFQPSLFKVFVRKIEKPILPDLDEAFAQRLGVKTMEEVYSAVKKQLELSAKLEQKQKVKQAIEDSIIQIYSFDLPKSIVEKDSKMLEKQMTDTDSDTSRREKALQDTTRRLTLYYLFRKYNADHHITVTHQELNQELHHLLQQFPKEMLPQITRSLNEDIYAAILSEVVIRKGLEHLVDTLSK